MNSRLLALTLCALVTGAHAQLSSPLPPNTKSGASTKANPASTQPMLPGTIDLPGGSGPGVHSPNSPFAPLPSRQDVVPWSTLTDVKTKAEKNRLLPNFNVQQMALNQKTQRVQGFMMPLEPGEKQKHFLLTSVPMSCSFCTPGGPESMVEIKTKTPVKYTLEPVVVEGKFLVLPDDSYGLYYRMTDATAVN